MKVFIGWSGETSHQVAKALHGSLSQFIQALDPWLSSEDIAKGAQWNPTLETALSEANFGLICLTPSNLDSPWILFEAGIMHKHLDQNRVCPFLFGLSALDVRPPLSQFQTTESTKEDVRKLVHTLNDCLPEKKVKDLDMVFDLFWPKLEANLHLIPKEEARSEQKGTTEVMLEEILLNVRELRRNENPNAVIEGAISKALKEFESRLMSPLLSGGFGGGAIRRGFGGLAESNADAITTLGAGAYAGGFGGGLGASPLGNPLNTSVLGGGTKGTGQRGVKKTEPGKEGKL